ncbi:MAG: nucleotidyltransferase family protein [Nitrososphaerales archaeon]
MISVVVLAAGLSTRFGENKMLYPIEGEPMVRRVVKTALSSSIDEVVVVIGFEAEKVKAALKDLNCKLVENPEYATGGQSSSVKCGVKVVRKDADAVMILPADVAFIDREVIDMVVEKYKREKPKIVIASYKGKAGHPILFDRSLLPEILMIDEAGYGLKAVVKRHQDEVVQVETSTPNVLLDIDRKSDLGRRA